MSQLPTVKRVEKEDKSGTIVPVKNAGMLRKEIEIRTVSLSIPALVGLSDGYASTLVTARLNSREATALRALVEGFDNQAFESTGSRSANSQDLIRFVLNRVADDLGIL
jgi:hypothetical protein